MLEAFMSCSGQVEFDQCQLSKKSRTPSLEVQLSASSRSLKRTIQSMDSEASSRPESLEHESRDYSRRLMVGAAQRRPVGLRQRTIDGFLPCPELRALLTASLAPGADCQARASGPVTAGSGPDAAPTWISLRLRAVSGPTYVYSELRMAPNT
ncbi:uncharacterized protein CCOS01_15683 [Colletotrichum costaricense]|uniref:Uncharacterized protein n=1 Tax=Colletotrichum costaricense TaxID=1209916 RepID=A0AAI9YGV2_9PEZI|nr:uncharacterized protein CCOS01_15683 [Colletotrichum costaricense]KAI3550543.1 hypothetical protein CSPX01_01593 [Colletotrichum filicis]KAK1509167.1 hypothetical protein CCOS01_15683 [Colletotrichum costaricense]